MNKMLITLIATVVCSFSTVTLAAPKEVTLTTTLKDYGGEAAYFAIYLTDSDARYQQTLWVGGKKSQYYKSLLDWAYGSKKRKTEYDGKSGASLKSGRTFTVEVTIDDALLDAGYQIRIDTSVEREKRVASDVVVPFTTVDMGRPVVGTEYVESFIYAF
jgi:hypothetical protein